MMKTTIISILIWLAATTWPVCGQVVIRAQVLDAAGRPLDHALVYTSSAFRQAYSDTTGRVEIEVPALPVELVFHLLGYQDKRLTVTTPDAVPEVRLGPATITLNEILVREKEDPMGRATLVTRDNVDAYNINGLFGEIPGIGLVKRGNYATEPVLRGFKHERLNIRYDGAARIVHACPNHMDPITSHIAPEEIQKIEVVKGPFDVRYGPTTGGVINLVTRHTGTAQTGWHGFAGTTYGTNGRQVSGSAGLSFRNANWDMMWNTTYRHFGDYRDGDKQIVPSGFRTLETGVKLGLSPSSHHRLEAAYHLSHSRDIRHAGLPMDSPKDDGQLFNATYAYRSSATVITRWLTKVYASSVTHLMTNEGRPNFKIVEARTPVNSYTLGGKTEVTLRPAGSKWLVFAGMDWDRIRRTGSRHRKVKRNPKDPEMVFDPPKELVDTVWGDATITNVGFFVQAKAFPSRRWQIQAGVRADRVRATIANPPAELLRYYGHVGPRTDLNMSGHLVLTYKLSDHWVSRLSAGQGTQSPSMAQRFINHLTVGQDAYERVGNPNLSPEVNRELEWRLAGRSRRARFRVSAFVSSVHNYILARVDTTIKRKFLPFKDPKFVKRYANIDQARLYGAECSAAYEWAGHWPLEISASYLYGQNETDGEPLPQIAPADVKARLGYHNTRFAIRATYRFAAAQKRVSAAFGEVPSKSFQTVDLSAETSPVKGLKAGLRIKNIFDEAYYEHLNFRFRNQSSLSGFIQEPGRSWEMFVRYAF